MMPNIDEYYIGRQKQFADLIKTIRNATNDLQELQITNQQIDVVLEIIDLAFEEMVDSFVEYITKHRLNNQYGNVLKDLTQNTQKQLQALGFCLLYNDNDIVINIKAHRKSKVV